ncbi:MAG: extracellular solute-binding protein [Oscillospiraceae bacterium]|nr:extracellular solute-binding protein [Oscillospiraceae bacterium]
MSKIKYNLGLIIAALLVIAGVLYIYFAHYAPYRPPEPQTLSVWYVDDDAMWDGFAELCAEYNEEDGGKYGIGVQPKAFNTTDALYDEVSELIESGGELPDMIACDTDFAAWLDEKAVLADMDEYFGDWETSKYDEYMTRASRAGENLVAVPIAAETNVFIVNTDKFSDISAVSNFEKLCSVSSEYYSRNFAGFFTISDYSLFFRNAMAQLGDDFDAVSPHDTKSENCKYIYKQLAETAYDRGFTPSDNAAVYKVAEGKLPCAIVSSADIMKYAGRLEGDNISFAPFPYMKDGKPVYTEKVTGMSILASDSTRERSAAMFIKWFASSNVNSRFVGDSGYIAAAGTEASGSDSEVYVKLMQAVKALKEAGSRVTYEARAEYSENSRNFDNVLRTIMNSLN